MITTIDAGTYDLTETRHGIKLLRLRGKSYAWIVVPRIGAILVYTTLPHSKHETLSQGSYQLYSVVDEPHLSDQLHLELEFGNDMWQGYLLPTGFPTRRDTRRRIIPTSEVITHNPRFYVARVAHKQKEAAR